MKNVVQDLTSAGIDWQREKWQSGLGSKFIHQGEKNAAKYADEVIVLSKGVQDYFKETYGRETHFIPNGVNTLNSVLQQTLKDIEVIVVNDGSNDQSLVECYRLQEIDKRIIIINQDNQGVSKARNVGKQNATGDYIIFIDADDELDCRMLEILYANIFFIIWLHRKSFV